MKSDIFTSAIVNRKPVSFLYNMQEIVLEPYYVSTNSLGKKAIYGRINGTSQIKMFQYDRIFNLRVLNWHSFSPIIPIMHAAN
ncbi:MAG: hypothetical protein K9G63_03390 [Melioribacteraceae bacterium]|nr:hypothetical protein [Melioribacteraceae bacterium]